VRLLKTGGTLSHFELADYRDVPAIPLLVSASCR
jgi:hypothetical protein